MLVELLPLILGAVLAPAWVIVVLLLLASPRGLGKATAFVLGMTLTRLLQGLLFGAVFARSPDAAADGGGPSPVVSTLLLVIGLLLLVSTYRAWRKTDDPDAPPPTWTQTLTQTSPRKALGLGAAAVGIDVKQWVFTLSAIGVIREADPGMTEAAVAYLLYVVLAQSFFLLALLAATLAPQASAALFQRGNEWLTRHTRSIAITVGLVFGGYFLWTGLSGLLT